MIQPMTDKIVICVDDDEMQLSALRASLEKYFHVYAVSNGEDLIVLLHTVVPHLIILDIVMPDPDGWEVLTNLKSNRNYKNIPVLMLSGEPSRENEFRSLKMGAVEFMRKPYKMPELVEHVQHHMSLQSLKDNQQKLEDIVE